MFLDCDICRPIFILVYSLSSFSTTCKCILTQQNLVMSDVFNANLSSSEDKLNGLKGHLQKQSYKHSENIR